MVRKGAEDIMGGKILEYEAKTIFQNGIRFGREEGREEERYEIITNMLRDGMNINTIARIVKMTAEQVMAIGKKAAVLWALGHSDVIVWVAFLYGNGQM